MDNTKRYSLEELRDEHWKLYTDEHTDIKYWNTTAFLDFLDQRQPEQEESLKATTDSLNKNEGKKRDILLNEMAKSIYPETNIEEFNESSIHTAAVYSIGAPGTTVVVPYSDDVFTLAEKVNEVITIVNHLQLEVKELKEKYGK